MMRRIGVVVLLMIFGITMAASAQDSLNIRTLGQLNYWFYTNNVLVNGNFAYVGVVGGGLRVLDISHPASPVEVGFNTGLGCPQVVIGNYGYCADLDGLTILDLTNPTAPRIAGFCRELEAHDVAVAGNYAYLTCQFGGMVGSNGLAVVDITNPMQPQETGFCHTPAGLSSVTVAGNYAYVTSTDATVRVINIANPTAPVDAGSCNLPDNGQTIFVRGDYAFIADYSAGLRTINIADPAAPVETGFCDTPGNAYDLAVLDNYIYVADGDSGLQVVSISNPDSPVRISHFQTPDMALGLAVSGNHAFVADADSGLRIMDITNPTMLTEIGVYGQCRSAYRITAQGDYAYILGTPGFQIVNVTNPHAPFETGFCFLPRAMYLGHLAALNNYVYVANMDSGLSIIDVSNPTAPNVVGHITSFGWVYDVCIQGQIAYVGAGQHQPILHVFDLTNPTNPTEISMCNSDCERITVLGDYAYAGSGLRLSILDISNPSSPVEIGHYVTNHFIRAVAVNGNYVYLAVEFEGLLVIDISNPTSPVEAGAFEIASWNGDLMEVQADGNNVFMTTPFGDLVILDVNNPVSPQQTGFYQTPGGAMDLAVQGSIAYVADGTLGGPGGYFGIYDCSAAMDVKDNVILHPVSFSLSCYPNPFNSSTTISLTLPRAGVVKLAVYDVLGQEVKNALPCAATVYSAGEHHITFNGAGLSSGIYFVRMEADAYTMTKKMVLIK
jgi:hypothetical protein